MIECSLRRIYMRGVYEIRVIRAFALIAAALIILASNANAQTAATSTVTIPGATATITAPEPTATATTTVPAPPPSNTLIAEPIPGAIANPAVEPAKAPLSQASTATLNAPAATSTIATVAATSTVPIAQPVPAPIVEPPAPAMFIVRTGPMLTEKDKDRRAGMLRAAGYHPITKKETVPGGGEYFLLELGRFWDMALAVDLLFKIKQLDSDFFIVGTQISSGAGDMPIGDRLNQLFPHKDGEDSLKLLENKISANKPAPAAVDSSDEGTEKLIVRRVIRLSDKGTAKPKQSAPVSGGGASVKADRAPGGAVFVPNLPQPVSKTPEPILDKLRQAAWNMRENGFDVYLEDEKHTSPEGVLVGIFENKDDAVSLAEELKGYGYTVSIIQQEDIAAKYRVYADPQSASGDISVITPDTLRQYNENSAFNPPSNPASDSLLELSQPREINR